MQDDVKLARIAGLLYLGIIAAGISGEFILRGPMIQSGDTEATRAAVSAGIGLWRASILADLAMAAFDIALALVLFRLLRRFGPDLALSALVLRLVQMAVIAAHLPLIAQVPDAADPMALIERHAMGYDLGLWFFGLNGIAMAILLVRAGAPRFLAGLIGGAAAVYLAGSALRFAAPDLVAAFQPAYLWPLIAELSLAIWLLAGARSLTRP